MEGNARNSNLSFNVNAKLSKTHLIENFVVLITEVLVRFHMKYYLFGSPLCWNFGKKIQIHTDHDP